MKASKDAHGHEPYSNGGGRLRCSFLTDYERVMNGTWVSGSLVDRPEDNVTASV